MRKNAKLLTKLAALGFFLFFNTLLIWGCGPSTFTRTRIDFQPYSSSEYRQEKSGLMVENKTPKEFPKKFMVNVQSCNQYNQLEIDVNNKPKIENSVPILPKDSFYFKYYLTNNTNHIIRLNRAVIRLFDPAGNDYEPLSKDELVQTMLSERPCSSTQTTIVPKLNLIKLIGRNTELLPNLTAKGYLVFKPTDPRLPGTWTLRMYEIPIETDAAGAVTKTEKFELRTVVKKYIDTYRRDSIFDKAVKIDTKEEE